MPVGKGHRFTERQHRQALHVKASVKASGKSDEEAERIGWATVAKQKTKKRGLAALRSK